MTKKFSQVLLLLIISSNAFSQISQTTNKTIQYSGSMKNVKFQYFSNWVLDDGSTELTITPDDFKSYVEIHRDILTKTESEKIKEIKEEGTEVEETTFNGMKAYKSRYGYFIFFNNYLFTIGSRKGDNKNMNDQLEQTVKSINLVK